MTDKELKAKIIAEIKRLYNQSLEDKNRQAARGLESAASASYGKSIACKELLSFADTLQEEPVSLKIEKSKLELIHKRDEKFKSITEPLKVKKNYAKLELILRAWWSDTKRIISKAIATEEPVSKEFEKALTEEWNGYVNRGAATVDALEDNTQELAFAKGFYRGSNWQKNHIWHDANERPQKIGVKTAWITNDRVFYSGWYNKSAFGNEDMRDSIVKFEFDKIRKWCYLDDLLNTD